MSVRLDNELGIPSLSLGGSAGLPAGFSPIGVALIVGVILSVIVAFYGMLSGIGESEGANVSLPAVMILIAGVALANTYFGFMDANVSATIRGLFNASPEVDVVVDQDPIGSLGEGGATTGSPPVPENPMIEEVFHIPNNEYTYPNAKAICKAYGGRLATYKEVESAYNRGADWCSYGWSADQMALFPTQYAKWEYLQTQKGHENDCGRPGINGGYIANPAVKFGINCYGHKPLMTQAEADLMSEAQPYPKTPEELKFDRRVDHWRQKLSQILVAPFNAKSWSVL